ncbi:MAG: hypothetical protein K0M40_14015 [Prolixibacteraceae bacterium]|nr:hypothetical protein [Prolixibacteraceae bacterium]
MLKRVIKNIWKDSVGGNLIATVLIAILTLLYNYIVSRYKSISFKEVFIDFWTYQIDLWIVLLFILTIIVLYSLIKSKFNYDEETLDLDRAFFNKIRNWEGMLDLVLEIKTNGFSSRPVKFERIETMTSIRKESEKPDFHFFNPVLNKIKTRLLIEFENLDSVLLGNIYGDHNGWLSIPSEWEYSQRERMLKAEIEIKKQEDIFTEVYQNFITQGRKILKV